MVQNKKHISSTKKAMHQDADRKSQTGASEKSADMPKSRDMKQSDMKNKSGMSKRDVSSRK